MKLFLIQHTSFLYFTFQSLFPAQGGKWMVGFVGFCWLVLNHDRLEHWPGIKCKMMVGSALRVDENTCCSVECGSGVCTRGTWLGNQFQHCRLPFLKSGFIFLKRAPKPGCGWPSCDSMWEAKGFLAFPFAESSPAAVSPLSALAVLEPSPFPPWPSSGAWSYSSGEPCVPAWWGVLFLSYLKWSQGQTPSGIKGGDVK